MSRGWIPRGPLKGPLSNVGGKAEEGGSGIEPGALEGGVTCHSRPVFTVFPFLVVMTAAKRLFSSTSFSSFLCSTHLFAFPCLCVCCAAQDLLPSTKLTSPDLDLTASFLVLVITMCVFLICLVVILLTQAASEHFILAFTTRLLDTEEQLS